MGEPCDLLEHKTLDLVCAVTAVDTTFKKKGLGCSAYRKLRTETSGITRNPKQNLILHLLMDLINYALILAML